MRLVRAMSDVTIGTLIVIVHAAIADRMPRPGDANDAARDRRRGLRRVYWPEARRFRGSPSER